MRSIIAIALFAAGGLASPLGPDGAAGTHAVFRDPEGAVFGVLAAE
jgi:predicted enzyme related to lactoylglutathione lyase